MSESVQHDEQGPSCCTTGEVYAMTSSARHSTLKVKCFNVCVSVGVLIEMARYSETPCKFSLLFIAFYSKTRQDPTHTLQQVKKTT